MNLTDLSRHQLRYVLFRLKADALPEPSDRLTGVKFQTLLKGWGHDVSLSTTRKLLAAIKTHISGQLYFSGWEYFADEKVSAKTGLTRGTNKSWDIGMIDGDGGIEAARHNQARMVNRPNKWFLFDRYYTEVVPTRGLSGDVTIGLDYFEGQGLTMTGGRTLRETRFYPDRSGRNREFNYDDIYQKGMTHGTHH